MGQDSTAGVGPPQTVSQSIAFLCGSRAWSDRYLMQGKTWAAAIQSAAGGAPGVQVESLASKGANMVSVIDNLSKTSATAQLSDATLDQFFGGLRGHSLIIVTHGLEPHDDTLTKAEIESAQGILLHNEAQGESPLDLLLLKGHLDWMTTRETGSGQPEDANVIVSPSLPVDSTDPETQKTVKEVQELTPVVDALRRSIYSRIYLAACGGDRRLEKFAHRLALLTLKAVHYNVQTLFLPDTPAAPFAQVGTEIDNKVHVSQGTRFFKDPSDMDNNVDLESTTTTFLPGSQHWDSGWGEQ